MVWRQISLFANSFFMMHLRQTFEKFPYLSKSTVRKNDLKMRDFDPRIRLGSTALILGPSGSFSYLSFSTPFFTLQDRERLTRSANGSKNQSFILKSPSKGY